MERIFANCKKCNGELGSFVNLWTQIGKSYISPIVKADGSLNIIWTGPVRLGETQTLVDHCKLQDVTCGLCRALVGLRCVETPANHVLHEDQLMLRLVSIMTFGSNAESELQLNIQRTLKLRVGSRNSSMPHDGSSNPKNRGLSGYWDSNFAHADDSIDLGVLQADLNAQKEEISRIDSTGYQFVSAFDSTVLRIESEVKKLQDGLSDLQRHSKGQHDQGRILESDVLSLKAQVQNVRQSATNDTKVAQLETGLATATQIISGVREEIAATLDDSTQKVRQEHDSTKSELDETRRQLKGLKNELEHVKKVAKESVSTARAYARDSLSMRAELKQLKEEWASERSKSQTSGNTTFPTDELEILTRNITKIGNRASQVETLQMELQLLKGRVQRVESRSSEISSPALLHTSRGTETPRMQMCKDSHSMHLEKGSIPVHSLMQY
ncbi:hypothetical protein BJ170DRAFT_23540 [Xylariales sp. AK1849]|nr:hypothetical protein BJ170DRAFT_23540 [Xylariales sp. AK1849]